MSYKKLRPQNWPETTDSDAELREIGEPDFIKPVLPKTTIEDLNSLENMLQDAGYRKKLISCQIWLVLTLLYFLVRLDFASHLDDQSDHHAKKAVQPTSWNNHSFKVVNDTAGRAIGYMNNVISLLTEKELETSLQGMLGF
jgi:hypothetical protein